MLIVYRLASDSADARSTRLQRQSLGFGEPIPSDAVWVDLVEPTREEAMLVEASLGIEMPTREDMEDIELSEILYHEKGARYVTVKLLVSADKEPDMVGVTFVLKENTLVTVRYDEPRAFQMFAFRASKPGGAGQSAEAIFQGLIEVIIDRSAEVLQVMAEEINVLSRSIFEQKGKDTSRGHQQTLRALGHAGTLISMSRESLVSLERALLFLSASFRNGAGDGELRKEIRTIVRDIQSLEEHATFQSGKIQFLLDATLGLVNLEQNNIIKLFSVMSVVFMPPTLIASIYGMNFQNMPELDWQFGYPVAICVMIMAAVTPYIFFRWKGWL